MRAAILACAVLQGAAFTAPGAALMRRSTGLRMAAPPAEAAPSAETRFGVGDLVECNLGSSWGLGRVVATNYESAELGEVPYRVKLTNEDRVILAPADRDTAIRKAADAPAPKRDEKEEELRATFYSFDLDNGGSIDADELADALDSFGYTLSKERVQELFYQFGKNDVLDLAQFKVMMKTLDGGDAPGIRKQPRMKEAMDLFRKYDADRSGTIDKFEFKAINAELNEKLDASTRNAFAAGAAAAAAAEFAATQVVPWPHFL